MICLLVDTSHIHAFLALYRITDKEISCLAKREWSHHLVSHDSYIVEAFDQVLKEANILPSRIQALYLGMGPGRFTGLRVAFSFMKTLSYVVKQPVHVCSSLRIWAEPHLQTGGPGVLVLINAFKNSVFTACFKKIRQGDIVELLSPCFCVPKKLDQLLPKNENLICIGDAFFIYKDHIPESVKANCSVQKEDVLRARSFAHIVKENPEVLSEKSWSALNPVYLKEGFFKRSPQ